MLRENMEQEIQVEDIYYELATHMEDNDGKDVPLLLKYMLTIEEAAVCLEMPDTIKNIAMKLDQPEERILELVKSCVRKGAVHYGSGSKQAYFVKYIVTLTDYGMATPHYDKERGSKYFDIVRKIRMSEEYLKEFGKQIEEDGKGAPMFRVVPRWEAIRNIPGVMPCENIEEILKEFDGQISTVRCICRTTINDRFCAVSEGTVPEEGNCIKFGKVAEHYVENMGVGSYFSAKEIMEKFERESSYPMYHMLCNTREVLGGFCNCCSCCCDMRWGLNAIGGVKYGIAPSRFLAVVSKEKCIGCKTCMTKCPFDAISFDETSRKIVINNDVCMGCGVCVVNCKAKALKLMLVREPDFIPEGGPQHIYESLKSLELDENKIE